MSNDLRRPGRPTLPENALQDDDACGLGVESSRATSLALVVGEPLRDDAPASGYVAAMKSVEKRHVLTAASSLLVAAFVGGFIATILLLLLDAVFGWSSGWIFLFVWVASTALLTRVFLSEELPLVKDERAESRPTSSETRTD